MKLLPVAVASITETTVKFEAADIWFQKRFEPIKDKFTQ